MVAIWEWTLFIILFMLSAFFSGSETALMSFNRLKLRQMVENKQPKALIVQRLLKNPDRLLSTILIGNNLVNITLTALATSIAVRVFGQAGVGVAVGSLTILMLVFGEITPKTYAAVNTERFALTVAKPISILEIIVKPLVFLLSTLANFIIRVIGGEANVKEGLITRAEIRHIVKLGENQGAIDKDEREMIRNIFDLDNITIREVMVPRVDIVALQLDTPMEVVWKTFIKTRHSRLPIYGEALDDIIGIIYAKDLLTYFDKELTAISMKEILRKPYFVPESKLASELLKELRKEKLHIAIVLDEYGGTAGIVFMEDLVETVIGEIGDEYDQRTLKVEEVNSHEYIFNSRLPVEEVNEIMQLDLPDEDYDTIGGLIFHFFGRIPQAGETIEFSDVILQVEQLENNKIRKVRIKKT
ncbi:MAG: hemolysin family protein [Bacillota bacterium]|nr:hemolysin family protein [Bacillota bacterium]